MNMYVLNGFKQWVKQRAFRFLPSFFPTYQIPSDNSLQLVGLVCHRDAYLFLYAVQSFFYFTKRSFPVTIIDDGTLTSSEIALLRKHFKLTVYSLPQITKKLQPTFRKYPNLKRYILGEHTPIVRWKIAFMLLGVYSRYIFLDSDILFFQHPKEITKWIDNKPTYCLNLEYDPPIHKAKESTEEHYLDLYHSYGESLKYGKFPHINPSYNNGIFCVPDKKLIDPKRLDYIYKYFYTTYFDNQFPSDELALSCLLTNKYSRSLPWKDYRIQLIGPRPSTHPAICMHYCWQTKPFFVLDAIKLAYRTNNFRSP